MLSKASLGWIGIACLVGCLSVGVLVAGVILGFLLALATPILIVFTGLWIWKVVNIEPNEGVD